MQSENLSLIQRIETYLQHGDEATQRLEASHHALAEKFDAFHREYQERNASCKVNQVQLDNRLEDLDRRIKVLELTNKSEKEKRQERIWTVLLQLIGLVVIATLSAFIQLQVIQDKASDPVQNQTSLPLP